MRGRFDGGVLPRYRPSRSVCCAERLGRFRAAPAVGLARGRAVEIAKEFSARTGWPVKRARPRNEVGGSTESGKGGVQE